MAPFAVAHQWDLDRLKLDTAADLVRRLATEPDSKYCHAPGQ